MEILSAAMETTITLCAGSSVRADTKEVVPILAHVWIHRTGLANNQPVQVKAFLSGSLQGEKKLEVYFLVSQKFRKYSA